MTIGVLENGGNFIYAEGEDRNLDGIIDTGGWNSGNGPGETDSEKADTDGGGALDGIEIITMTKNYNPLDPSDDGDIRDTDRDGLTDEYENSTQTDTLWNKSDTDSDGLWDGYNVDIDNDGILDQIGELIGHNGFKPTNPIEPDTDGDGLLDGEEVKKYFTDPTSVDTDGDGLWDGHDYGGHLGELDGHYGYGPTNPLKPDTDNDTLYDGYNVDLDGDDINETMGEMDEQLRTDPNNPDTDDDELRDNEEFQRGTDPTNWDTDGGSVGDGIEVFRIPQTNPLDPADDVPQDTDNDGLLNIFENSTTYTISTVDLNGDGKLDYHTHWKMNDTDQDGLLDGEEVNNFGSYPLVSDSDADGIEDGMEVRLGGPGGYITNPRDSDTDGDGLPDGWIDVNKNGEPDWGEFEDRNLNGIVDEGDWNSGAGPGETDPSKSDTDGGGTHDFDEIILGMNPLDPDDDFEAGNNFVDTKLVKIDFPNSVNKTVGFIVEGEVIEVTNNMPVPGAPVEIFLGYDSANYLAGTGIADTQGKFTLTCAVPPILEVGLWPIYIQTRTFEFGNIIYNGTSNVQDYNVTVYSITRITIDNINSPIAINSVVTLEGKLFDATNYTIPNRDIEFWVQLESGATVALENVTTDSYGRYYYLFDATFEEGFELGSHKFYASFEGSKYLHASERSANLEILADVSDITITVEPKKQVVGKMIWVNGTISVSEGPAPSGELEIKIVRISTGYKYTEHVTLNGTTQFQKQIILPSDLNADQYRVFAEYSIIETSNSVTIIIVGLTDFVMDSVRVHRGDPPVTISAALVDNTHTGVPNSAVKVEYEGEHYSLISDEDGELSFQFKADLYHPLGAVPITFTFDGDDDGTVQYIGVTVIRNIAVTSPTFISIDSYPSKMNRSDSLQVSGRVRDDQDIGVSNSNIVVYISHIYLHEFTTDANGYFTFNKLLSKSISIGIRTLELDFVGNEKYENSTASELIGIYDQPWLDLHAVTELARGEPFRAVVEIRDPNGIEPLANELIEIRVGDDEPITKMTNSSGKVEFQSIFPEGEDEVKIHVIYKGDGAHYLLPVENTYTLSLKESDESSEFLENFSSAWPLILGLCLVIIVAYFYSRWRRRHIEEIKEIISEMEEELETTDEIRKAIYQAYKRMLEVLHKYGFLRRKSDTPREFANAVRKALPEIDRKNLDGLTTLFEEARYSDHELTKRERFKALKSLRKVKASIEQLPPPKTGITIGRIWPGGKKSEA
ncbi:MAG: DUF4129 domain-containing protein [Thermoplasmata archaeon]|nr:MAG: DUF4129 domain-containing protein [Thermoplasmata archaeon]